MERSSDIRALFPNDSARERAAYAVSIFEWCRAHPERSADDLLAMIAKIEARVAVASGGRTR